MNPLRERIRLALTEQDGNFVHLHNALAKLNRLEKLGLLAAGEWNIYRKIRNDLTHTYPEESEDLVDAINQAAALIDQLEASFIKMRSFCQVKLGLLNCGA